MNQERAANGVESFANPAVLGYCAPLGLGEGGTEPPGEYGQRGSGLSWKHCRERSGASQERAPLHVPQGSPKQTAPVLCSWAKAYAGSGEAEPGDSQPGTCRPLPEAKPPPHHQLLPKHLSLKLQPEPHARLQPQPAAPCPQASLGSRLTQLHPLL